MQISTISFGTPVLVVHVFDRTKRHIMATSPAAFAPLRQMWSLVAKVCVVAVARIDHGGVVVHVEHPGADVIQQLGEIAGLPRLADASREQAVAGDRLEAGGQVVRAVEAWPSGRSGAKPFGSACCQWRPS